MSSNLKFPSSVEIKRVIAAVIRAGIHIGLIEIHPRKITIHPKDNSEPELSPYDVWKMSKGRDTSRIRHTDDQSDAQRRKSVT